MTAAASPSIRPTFVGLILATGVLLAACGGSAEDAASTSVTSAAPTDPTSTTAPTTTTSEPAAPTSEPTTTLAGEPIDFGPRPDDVVAVIGVAFDDVLNVRTGPGTDAEIVDTLDPLTNDLTALGTTRHEVPGFWVEVDTADAVGWVNLVYIGYLGVTDDLTAQVIDDLGERPSAETMADLGMQVAETFASDDPPSTIVQVTDATMGDLGEVTFDVIGLGDDALAGFRVHVFGQPSDDGASFTLMAAEVTSLCGRGVTDDLLCT